VTYVCEEKLLGFLGIDVAMKPAALESRGCLNLPTFLASVGGRLMTSSAGISQVISPIVL
jgi:hypothetical protein